MTDDATRAALDAATAALALTPAERRAVRLYQSVDGHGSRLNALLAGEALPATEGGLPVASALTLDAVLRRAALPLDLVLYRGSRPGEVPDLDALPAVRSWPRFASTSLSHDVAREAAEGGVVVRLLARRRTSGLWLPPVGYRTLAYEEEVLLPRGGFYRLLAWTRTDDRVLVYGEVM